MALGNIFGQFSLRALGKRILKRFGGTLKRRFLRQNSHQRFSRFEKLEDRSLMTVTPTFSNGTLDIVLDAAGDDLTITAVGTNNLIRLTPSGTTAYVAPNPLPPGGNQFQFPNVTAITVRDTGTATAQTVTFSNLASNSISLNNGDLQVTGIELVVFANTQTISARSLTIAPTTGGTIKFNGGVATDTISTTLDQTYGNTVTTNGDVGLRTTVTTATGIGVSMQDVVLNSGTLTITNDGTISGVITGNGGITKTGTGTLTFAGTGTNGYSGLTTLVSGELDLFKTGQAVGGPVQVNGGKLLMRSVNQFSPTNSDVTVTGGTFDFNTPGFSQSMRDLNISGTASVLGNNTPQINVNRNFSLTGGTFLSTSLGLAVSGNWSSPGGLFQHNNGHVDFASATIQTFQGFNQTFNDIFHTGIGTLVLLDSPNLVGTFTNSIGAGPVDLNGAAITMRAFSLLGGSVITSRAGGTLGLTGAGPFDLQSGTVSAALVGSSAVNKTGTGRVVLSGANTYAGGTTVTNGTLEIDGTVVGDVNVLSTGTLNGIGTINGSVTGSGTFSPGSVSSTGASTTGVMRITGRFAPTGLVLFDANSPFTAAGADYDQFIVSGIGIGALNAVDLSGATVNMVFTDDSTPPANNALLTLINNTSFTTTIPSIITPENSKFQSPSGRATFLISYSGFDGNNVVVRAVTPVVSIDVNPPSVSEVGGRTLIYTFTRRLILPTGPELFTTGPLKIKFTVSGTAKRNIDYTASSPDDPNATFNDTEGTITFANGSATATIVLTPKPDSLVEPNETITLKVVSDAFYLPVPSPSDAATGTITDNSITGTKYNDRNGDGRRNFDDLNSNGIQDPGEPSDEGIPGVLIWLDLNNDGLMSITEPAATTDNYGHFTLPNVQPGNYVLRESAPPSAGGIQTQPGTATGAYFVNVPNDALSNLDFGNSLRTANDYGDAPDSYGTTLAANGASAGILANFHLGTLEDGEPNGQPNSTATGDDVVNAISGQVDDEDGVTGINALPDSGTKNITVSVVNGNHSPGKLSAWIDFDRNNKFDSYERVIANQVLSQAQTTFTITVPSGTQTGTTFARFRYGYDFDIGPTGPSQAGEVEDYQVTIVPASGAPTANPDTFPQSNPPELQSQGVIKPSSANYLFDVLRNDIGGVNSFGGTLHIVDVTQPITSASTPGGSLSVVSHQFSDGTTRDVLSYTPAAGVQGGTTQTFTYRVQDINGIKSAPATDTIVISLANNIAIDDTFTVQAGTAGSSTSYVGLLTPLQNDLTAHPLVKTQATDMRPVVIAVAANPGGNNTVEPDPNNLPILTPSPVPAVFIQASTGLRATLSINSADPQKLDFTAEPGFLGSAFFEYAIDEEPTNDDPNTGSSTRFVTVQVVNGVAGGIGGINGTAQITATSADLTAAHYLAELDTTVVMADPTSGDPTDTVTIPKVGTPFFLRVQAKDLRPVPSGGTFLDRGVQEAYLDMLLNPGDTGNPFRTYAHPMPDDSSNPMDAIITATANGFAMDTRQGQNGVDKSQIAGEFNETGDLRQSATGLGTNLASVFYVKMIATTPTPTVGGTPTNLVVAGDPADATDHSVVLMSELPNTPQNPQSPVITTDNQIFLKPFAFPILSASAGEFTNFVNPRDVDLDGEVTASDVVTVINNINANGSHSLVGLTPSTHSPLIDVNMDMNVTSMDVLSIINFINALTVRYTVWSNSQTAASTTSSLDTSLTSLSASSDVQSSASTTSSTPTLLTDGSSSTTSPSSTPSSTSSTTTSSTSTSSSTVDSAAADDIYASLEASRLQLLKRYGR